MDGAARSAGSSRGRGIAFRLIAGLIVAGSVLGAIELGLRLVHGPAEPPVQVYSGVGELPTYFEQDHQGLRPLYQHRAAGRIHIDADRPRVGVLGGSSVRGGSVGLEPNQEFPSLMSRLLGTPVHNLGNPSVDSHDIVRIVEELLVARFAALVVYTGHNDYGNSYFHQRYGTWSAGTRARIQSGLERLQIFCRLRAMAGRVRANSATPDGRNQFAAPAIGPAQREAATHYFERNLSRVAWLTAEAGVPLVLVTPAGSLTRKPMGRCVETLPCAHTLWQEAEDIRETDPQEAARLYREARDADSIPLRALGSGVETVRRVARSHGLTLIDAAVELPSDGEVPVPGRRLFIDVVHFSRAGHQAMAELIAPQIKDLLGVAQPR